MNKGTTFITGLLTLLLALAAFVLSFNNLTMLATEAGYTIPWLFPMIIEGAVIVFSVRMLWNSLNGEPSKWQWACIIGASVAATFFNVYHSNTENTVAMLMAGLPSVLLLLAFETLISQIKKITTRSGLAQSIADLEAEMAHKKEEFNKVDAQAKAEHERLMAELQKQRKALEQSIVAKKQRVQPKKTGKQKRQQKLQQIYAPDKSKTMLAKELGVHVNTVSKDIEELSLNGK